MFSDLPQQLAHGKPASRPTRSSIVPRLKLPWEEEKNDGVNPALQEYVCPSSTFVRNRTTKATGRRDRPHRGMVAFGAMRTFDVACCPQCFQSMARRRGEAHKNAHATSTN
eukprot:1188791-Prorocentrum_minimum.AAC.1